jgi:hypothetical protein
VHRHREHVRLQRCPAAATTRRRGADSMNLHFRLKSFRTKYH